MKIPSMASASIRVAAEIKFQIVAGPSIAGPREARNPNLDIDQRIVYYACAPGI